MNSKVEKIIFLPLLSESAFSNVIKIHNNFSVSHTEKLTCLAPKTGLVVKTKSKTATKLNVSNHDQH